MPDRENVMSGLRSIKTYLASQAIESTDDFAREGFIESQRDIDDALAMLKEQEKQKQNWLKQIADTQLLNAPCEWQSEDQRLYAKGVWDGLQIAWNIISEGR